MSYLGPSSSLCLVNQNNYFSIDDILATQERVLCKFELTVPNMGYIDPGCETEHILPGTQLEFPLWMARALHSRNRRIASIDLPKHYRAAYREVLTADAAVVDLRRLNPYFYGIGTRLMAFDHAESGDVARSLLQTYQTRLRKIMDASQNAVEVDSVVLVESLDESEREVFAAGQRGLADFLRWETRQSDQLTASDMVTNLKKRKRVQMEES